jgi:hypothetical protein
LVRCLMNEMNGISRDRSKASIPLIMASSA